VIGLCNGSLFLSDAGNAKLHSSNVQVYLVDGLNVYNLKC